MRLSGQPVQPEKVKALLAQKLLGAYGFYSLRRNDFVFLFKQTQTNIDKIIFIVVLRGAIIGLGFRVSGRRDCIPSPT